MKIMSCNTMVQLLRQLHKVDPYDGMCCLHASSAHRISADKLNPTVWLHLHKPGFVVHNIWMHCNALAIGGLQPLYGLLMQLNSIHTPCLAQAATPLVDGLQPHL